MDYTDPPVPTDPVAPEEPVVDAPQPEQPAAEPEAPVEEPAVNPDATDATEAPAAEASAMQTPEPLVVADDPNDPTGRNAKVGDIGPLEGASEEFMKTQQRGYYGEDPVTDQPAAAPSDVEETPAPAE